MRRIKILNITPSGLNVIPSFIDVGNPLNPLEDFTPLFHGKEWIDQNGARSPYYVYGGVGGVEAPYGTELLVATTFKITGNTKYDGTYTVYTKPSNNINALESSEFSNGVTRIRIDQSIPPGSNSELTDGYVTNISTYLIDVVKGQPIILLEKEYFTTTPVEFTGKLFTGWGEVFAKNMVRAVQNYAAPFKPAGADPLLDPENRSIPDPAFLDNPFYGQTWMRADNNWLHVWDGVSWIPLNAKHEHTQTVALTAWSVQHNLEKRIVDVQVFVDTASGMKIILPQDITFNDDNTLTITLSNASTGVVRVSR